MNQTHPSEPDRALHTRQWQRYCPRVRANSLSLVRAAALGALFELLASACGGKSIIDGSERTGSAGASDRGGGGSSAGGPSGGSSASGAGTTSGGNGAAGGDSCSSSPSCGGDLTGTWSAVSSCLRVSGQLDLSELGVGCPGAPVTGHRAITGTWSANADGTYRDATTTTGVDEILLSPACLRLSGTQVPCTGVAPLFTLFGYGSATCEEVPAGGCKCSARIAQSGGLGVVSERADTHGSLSVSGDGFTVDGQARYSYCASPNHLTVTPRSGNPTLSGTIELKR